MAYIDDLINQQRAQQTPGIQKALRDKLAQLQNEQNAVQTEQTQNMPTYQNRINNENIAGQQEAQNLGQRAAATGNLTSDEMDSNLTTIRNGVMNRQAGIATEKSQYQNAIQDRLSKISQGRDSAQQDATDQTNQLEGSLQGTRTKYLMDLAQRQAATRAKVPKGPSVSDLNRQDKQNANDATGAAIEAIYRDAPNMTRAEFNRAINQTRSQWYRDGADMKQIDMEIKNVQTRDEIEAEQKAEYQQKLSERPWYQRAIDGILPGSQWG
jgi:hypothetical protein